MKDSVKASADRHARRMAHIHPFVLILEIHQARIAIKRIVPDAVAEDPIGLFKAFCPYRLSIVARPIHTQSAAACPHLTKRYCIKGHHGEIIVIDQIEQADFRC